MPCSRSRTGLIFMMILWAARRVPQRFPSRWREPIIRHKMVFSGTRGRRPTRHLRLRSANLNPLLPEAPASLCSLSVSLLLPTLLRPPTAQWPGATHPEEWRGSEHGHVRGLRLHSHRVHRRLLLTRRGNGTRQITRHKEKSVGSYILIGSLLFLLDWRLSDLGFVFPTRCKYP